MFKIIFHYLSIFNFTFLIFFLSVKTYSQPLSDSLAKAFIEEFINDSAEIEKYVLKEELELSKRLGISYKDIKNKFLISNDIEPDIRSKLQNKELQFVYNISKAAVDLSVLTIQIPAENITKEFYFYKSQLVSKPFYFAMNWKQVESEYFVFHISEPDFFNTYSVSKLDSFVAEMIKLLSLDETQINNLKTEKIHYFLCKDENEIELLTGYKARGLYFLPYDYVISTFNCHFHEVLHLLMNYRLQTIDLYTLPLFQEGFAVAYGGRGGIDPEVFLDMGLYMAQNNFLDYRSLLSKPDFNQFDASMTYPASGLYVKFLVETLGIERFISLYRKYSGSIAQINNMRIVETDLPPETEWQNYLNHLTRHNSISVSGFDESDFKSIIESESWKIFESNSEYLFKIKNTISISEIVLTTDYKSKLLEELFPGKAYQNQKYIIIASADEVSVYNLYSNILIAKYVKGFSMINETVIQKNGFFIFTITKNVFDEDLKNLKIENVEK